MTQRIETTPAAPGRRFAGELIGLLLLYLGAPGALAPDGSTLLAILGLGVWGAFAVRPLGERRRAGRFAEWLAGGLGMAPVMWWTGYVWPPILFYMVAGYGLYVLATGALARALAPRYSVGVAVAAAWLALETIRSILPPPAGTGWLRLGHFAHHHLWLSGSARVWGVEGLSVVLASLAGLLAAGIVARRVSWRGLALGTAPALLAALLSVVTAAPETVAGPRLLLVQPAFPQERKQFDNPWDNFLASRELTLATLDALEWQGVAPPDLVCWGESMLYVDLFEPEVDAAVARGVQGLAWTEPLTPEILELAREAERGWILELILGIGRPDAPRRERLPEGTSFLAGAVVYGMVDEAIRRRNAVVLYAPDGTRGPAAGKRVLVPGAETMLGLERLAFVRRTIESIAAYVPDFVAAEETGALELAPRDGRRFRLSGTVCFDNAFLAPYVEAVAAGPLDFHLVVSNEAWYRDSAEADHMVAFSRLIALSTGRAVVRATNSGISLGIGPDGRELGRIRVGERDRLVRGTLLLEVPVPAAGEDAGAPLYVRLRTWWRVLLVVLPVALLLLFRRAGGNPPGPGG